MLKNVVGETKFNSSRRELLVDELPIERIEANLCGQRVKQVPRVTKVHHENYLEWPVVRLFNVLPTIGARKIADDWSSGREITVGKSKDRVMCSNESPPPAKEPLAVGMGNPMAGFLPGLEHYRLQLYHYAMAERLRLAQQLHPQHPGGVGGHPTSGGTHLGLSAGFPAPLPLYPAAAAAAAAAGYPSRLALSMALLHPHHQRIPEEPKPQHSYIGLIAMAILSSPEKKLVLSDIYQHILEHYPYFRTRGPGWRNSIRHNLSLNDCFVKSGRSANGKGHYWAIHPANLEDFRRGDFRRRKAQRKVRRHMGLAVDEEPDSPSPPPLPATPPPPTGLVGPTVGSQSITGIWSPHHHHHHHHHHHLQTTTTTTTTQQLTQHHQHHHPHQRENDDHGHGQLHQIQSQSLRRSSFQPSRKRQFDVASLLAPDDNHRRIIETNDATTIGRTVKSPRFSCSEDEPDIPEPEVDQDEEEVDVDVDVVAETSTMQTPDVTPSASPEAKIVAPTNHCGWNAGLPGLGVAASAQPLAAIYLQNHLHSRNYYVQANAGSGSSV